MSPRHAHVEFAPPDLAVIEAERTRYKAAGLAPLTILSYERDWRVFCAWCRAARRKPFPASCDTVELYVTDLIGRGRKVTTLERHAAAIRFMHRRAGRENPCGPGLRQLLSGARRTLGQEPDQKDAVTVEDLRKMVRTIGRDTAIGARDCAILLFGFASALRRSTLASLRLEDLRFTREGIVAWVGREKQNRQGKGRQVAVPVGKRRSTCPVRALERWLEYRGQAPGPLFCRVMRGHPNLKPLLGNRIAQIVQAAARAIGRDASDYGAHSMRAGFASAALAGGAQEIAIARHMGHASLNTTRLYVRTRELFRPGFCAALSVGL